MRAVGLFSGVGGVELGMAKAGIQTELLCEWWEPAQRTLRRHFDTELVGDIRGLAALPTADVVTAGFPCTDLSQVGRTAGIDGDESGLVREVFRLMEGVPPRWLVLENVPNMLNLGGGSAIASVTTWLDENRWNWAYRTVDSQHFGVRQRRRRVFLVASRSEDPREVLFADEAGLPPAGRPRAYGFYWTEGNRGIGWGEGVTPTLKGGSKLGIPSPPGVWNPEADIGRRIVRPSIRSGEKLQGFPVGWTSGVPHLGERWKMIGNAVTVPVARWIGERLMDPGEPVDVSRRSLSSAPRWPSAASSINGEREMWELSERPLSIRPRHSLAALLAQYGSDPLSLTATSGFTSRLKASSLKRRTDFVQALDAHIALMSAG